MQNYNPYMAIQPSYQPQFQQPQYGNYPQYQQTQLQPNNANFGINGKIVNDFNEITIKDIPTDCSPAFFIKSDYSEIQSRRWSDTGNVIPMTYKAIDTSENVQNDPFSQLNERLDEIVALINKKPNTRKKEDEAQ